MAFENVNVTSLRNSLNQCKNAINHSTTDGLISSVSNASVWQSSAQSNLKNALSKLTNTRYKELENKLSNYQNTVNFIEKYQGLQSENKSKQQEIDYLTYYKLYKTNSQTGKKEKDANVDAKISKLRKQINYNKSEMNSLINRVSNSI